MIEKAEPTVDEISEILTERIKKGESPMQAGDSFNVADWLAAFELVKAKLSNG